MNRAQTIAHFDLFNQVCRKHGWHMAGGRLQGVPPEALGTFARKIWDQAAVLARADVRAATVADLRHALYFLACGHVSSKRIRTERDCTRVIGWLLLCLDDASLLGSVKAGQDARATHAARVQGIRRMGFPEVYLDKICRDRFNASYRAPFWEDLPPPDLFALYVLLRQRSSDQS